ncbi:MAG: peptidoglycan editing factor PgeF [Zetaproteobacteria bacterium]|nr:peptidoglycan editing factor PgeF [Zetaproteobacteria bacterium]
MAIFSTRRGGISPKPFNSLNFSTEVGDDPYNLQYNLLQLMRWSSLPTQPHQAKQVHDTHSLWCEGPGEYHNIPADILLSQHEDTPLAIRTADCLPIMLADVQRGIIAAVHAGWKGTANQIVKVAVDEMLANGCTAENIIASFGPCIEACCFEVNLPIANQLYKTCDLPLPLIQPLRADLKEINQHQLLDIGVLNEHIEIISGCTHCQPELYFSHRRDQFDAGRHLSIVAKHTLI